jgi:hypothetical protein
MFGRRWHRLWAIGAMGAIGAAVVACGSSDTNGPVDPEVAEAWRIEQDRLVAERRAQQDAEAALERAVLAIESETDQPPRVLEEGEVYQVLAYYCEECHYRPVGPTSAIDGFWDIDDMDAMVRTGKVTPGDGEGSRLIQRIRSGEMPPVSAEGPLIPAATVDRLVDYINSLASDSFD